MGLYDKLSKLDNAPPEAPAPTHSPVTMPRSLAERVQPAAVIKSPDTSQEDMASRSHDVKPDVMTSLLPEDVSQWRSILSNTETHNSALRLSAQERDDIEDCVLLLRRTLGVKTSMNELARLGLLLLVRDVRARKSKSIVCAVKRV